MLRQPRPHGLSIPVLDRAHQLEGGRLLQGPGAAQVPRLAEVEDRVVHVQVVVAGRVPSTREISDLLKN